jgi:hypothetical protein
MDTHNLIGSAVTVLLKEIDFTQKTKVSMAKGEVENYDIFGLTQLSNVSN